MLMKRGEKTNKTNQTKPQTSEFSREFSAPAIPTRSDWIDSTIYFQLMANDRSLHPVQPESTNEHVNITGGN